MKVEGFYMIGGDVVSPTVFRVIVMEKLSEMGFDISKVKEPTYKDRHDVIEFDESYTKEEIEEIIMNYETKKEYPLVS